MRGSGWGALLCVAACGHAAVPAALVAEDARAPVVASAPPRVAGEIATMFEVDRVSGRDLRLSFVAAACAAIRRVVVVEAADRVTVTLDESGRGGKDCTEPLLRHRDVRLAAPLGHRAVYDGALAPALLIRPAR